MEFPEQESSRQSTSLLNSILWLKFSIEILGFENWAEEHLQGVATLGNTLPRLQLVYFGKKWEEGLRQ